MPVKLAHLCFAGNAFIYPPGGGFCKFSEKIVLLEKCSKWSKMARKVKTLTSEMFALDQGASAKDLEKFEKFSKN